LHQAEIVEKILRINPDIIISSPLQRAQQTAEIIKKTLTTYREKDVELIVDNRLST
jgi:broad specificity phosphatase PhoE